MNTDLDITSLDSASPLKQQSCKLYKDIDNLQHVMTRSTTDICISLSVDIYDFDKVTIEQMKSQKIKKHILAKFFIDLIAAGNSV